VTTQQKQQPPPFGLRLPEELRDWLREQAERSRRSLNAEIIVRLEGSRRGEDGDAKAQS
jgi:hypothetical protein